ncbi:hypothetical protein MRX96_058328 [Rhipicephalus microplus]
MSPSVTPAACRKAHEIGWRINERAWCPLHRGALSSPDCKTSAGVQRATSPNCLLPLAGGGTPRKKPRLYERDNSRAATCLLSGGAEEMEPLRATARMTGRCPGQASFKVDRSPVTPPFLCSKEPADFARLKKPAARYRYATQLRVARTDNDCWLVLGFGYRPSARVSLSLRAVHAGRDASCRIVQWVVCDARNFMLGVASISV